jgi:hypothetical protein
MPSKIQMNIELFFESYQARRKHISEFYSFLFSPTAILLNLSDWGQ